MENQKNCRFLRNKIVHYFMFEQKVLQRCKAVLLEEKLKKFSIKYFCTRTHINFFEIFICEIFLRSTKRGQNFSLNSKVTFSPTERKIKDFSCGMIFPDQFYCWFRQLLKFIFSVISRKLSIVCFRFSCGIFVSNFNWVLFFVVCWIKT